MYSFLKAFLVLMKLLSLFQFYAPMVKTSFLFIGVSLRWLLQKLTQADLDN